MAIQDEWDSATPILEDEWESAAPISKEEWDSAAPVIETPKASKRGLSAAFTEATTPIESENMWEFLPKFAEKGLRIIGKTGQAAGDVLMSGAKAIYEYGLPPTQKMIFESSLKNLADTDVAKAQVKTLRGAKEALGKVAEEYPRAAENVEAGVNILNLIPAWQIGKAGVSMLPKMGAKTLDDVVEYGFKKGIKPSVEGKSDAGLTAKFYDDAKTATTEIVKRYSDDIPKNVEEFSQKVRQAKKDIWSESNGMAQAAGEKGAVSSVSPLRTDMRTVIDSPNVPKSAKSSAQKVLDEIESYGDEITPVEAEELIAHFNSRSKPFWNDPNPNKLDDAVFNERAASILRKTTDKSIETYEGPGWQDLRKRYGAQSAIEKAVNNRANVTARRNVKGFFDLTDVFSTGEFIAGIATMNPQLMAKAIAMRGAKKYIKSQNDVNNIVRKMFKDTKKIVGDRSAVKETILPKYPGSFEDPYPEMINVPFGEEVVPSRSFYEPYRIPSGTARAAKETMEVEDAAYLREAAQGGDIAATSPVRDYTGLDEIDARMKIPKGKIPDKPTLIEGRTIPPRPLDVDAVILPAIRNAFKNKLPTWVEDRLEYLGTVTSAHWTADDWLMIRNLQDKMRK